MTDRAQENSRGRENTIQMQHGNADNFGKRPIHIAAALASVLAVVLACLCGCPRPDGDAPIRVVVTDDSAGGDTGNSGEEVTELARREGEIAWYTSLPESQAREFLNRFEAKYPFITARLVRASTFDTIQRLETEIEEGRVQADVIHVLDVAVFYKLKNQGELLRYSAAQERFIPSRYKDPGYWSALRVVGLCIAYDSKRTKREDVPKTWPGLLDARWKGRIAAKDAHTAGSAYAQYYFLRDEYGISYWNHMAKQEPRIYKTAEESLGALERGEVELVSGVMGYSVSERRKAGSSVRAVWPEDGVPTMLGPVAILRAAPHRNAAKLFMEFALSKEGQEALRDLVGAYSVREDVDPPADRPRLSELKIMTPSEGWDEYAEKQDSLKSEYTTLFHPDSE